jgi:alpha 1,2-mannosyltransferase
VFVILFIVFLVLLSITSLYRTIPVNVPFFTSIPVYRNQWQYTPPTQLTQPNPQLSAAYITFVNGDTQSLSDLRLTMRYLEDVFNQKYNYPYIVFTNQDLTTEFKELVASVTKSDVQFEKVSKYDYGYGNTTDQFRAYLSRNNLKDTPGNTETFRFKSRLMAGTIFK